MTIIASLLVGMAAMYLYADVSGDQTETNVTINSIKKIAGLATVEYNMSVIVERKKKKKAVGVKLKTAKFLILLSGKVKGSVDLNQAKVNIDKEKKKVNIIFGKNAVKVSNPEVAPKGMKIITIVNPKWFNKLKDSDFNKGQEIAITELRRSALDNGIIKKTKDEAIVVLTNFLEALGYTSKIVFK